MSAHGSIETGATDAARTPRGSRCETRCRRRTPHVDRATPRRWEHRDRRSGTSFDSRVEVRRSRSRSGPARPNPGCRCVSNSRYVSTLRAPKHTAENPSTVMPDAQLRGRFSPTLARAIQVPRAAEQQVGVEDAGHRPRPCRAANHGSRRARSHARWPAPDHRGGRLERQHSPANQGRSQCSGRAVNPFAFGHSRIVVRGLRTGAACSPVSFATCLHPTTTRPSRSNRSIRSDGTPASRSRRRHQVAAGMLGLDQVLGRKPKEEAPIVMAASDQPVDIDHDGIRVPVDEAVSVVAPPQPRSDPLPSRRRPAKATIRERMNRRTLGAVLVLTASTVARHLATLNVCEARSDAAAPSLDEHTLRSQTVRCTRSSQRRIATHWSLSRC